MEETRYGLRVDLPATDAGHAFVFTGLQERLAVARQRIAALYERLANP